MNKNIFVSTAFALVFVLGVSALVIFFARGYTINTTSGKIQKTGIMVITSEPKDAAVYLNDELKSTTNTTLNFLPPGTYKVRVTKDGFTAWEKNVEVKPELVTRLDISLFPQVPDLRRLTLSGVQTVITTPDNTHIVYRVTEKTKKGLWVMGLSDGLPFVNTDPIQIYKDDGKINLDKAEYFISPDSKNILVIDKGAPTPSYYLLDLERVNDNLLAQKEADVQTLLLGWHDTLLTREKNLRQRLVDSVNDIPLHESPNPNLSPILAAIDKVIADTTIIIQSPSPAPSVTPPATPTSIARRSSQPSPFANPSITVDDIVKKMRLLTTATLWSPKQNKVIFVNDGQRVAYDLETGRYYPLPKAEAVSWFPSNLHVILLNPNGKKGEIVLSDIDGLNQVAIFSGTFVDGIAIPWLSGNRIVVLTNLNQAAGTEPNLYGINLR